MSLKLKFEFETSNGIPRIEASNEKTVSHLFQPKDTPPTKPTNMAKHKMPHKKHVVHKARNAETAETIQTALSTNDFSQLNYYQEELNRSISCAV